MFITWQELLSPIQFNSAFKIWRSVELFRIAPVFVVRIVDPKEEEDRTALLGSDEDVKFFLEALPTGWVLDSVSLLIPPNTLAGDEWRAVGVTSISRPLSEEERVVEPLVFGLADQTQFAGQPLRPVSHPTGSLQRLFTLGR